MRTVILLVTITVCSAALHAQRPKFQLNTSTAEGLLLSQASMESDDQKKTAMLEDFVQKFPKHAGMTFALIQLQQLYLKASQWDKVIAGAGAGLALDQANAIIAYNGLQACEKKPDLACIKDWSARTVDAANKMLAIPKPADEDDVEEWTREIDFAKQVIVRCEYSLYAAALQAQDAKSVVDMASTLETRHPASQYLPQVAGRYFVALQQVGDKAKAAAVAEKGLETDKTNEDMMAVVAEYSLQNQAPDKAVTHAKMLVDTMGAKAVPQGVDPAAWDKKKKALTGLGYWMLGIGYAGQSNWAEADKALRESLTYNEGNNDLMGPAYFYLGVVNHALSKTTKNVKLRAEAAKFSEIAAKMPGPYQEQAKKNLAAIRAGR